MIIMMKIREMRTIHTTKNARKKRPLRSGSVKGITQIDYIVAAGVFILVFALVVQFASNYFSNIGDKTTVRIMTDQARQLLDVGERGFEPSTWPYDSRNDSLILMLHMDNSTLDSSQYGRNGTLSGGINCSAAVIGRFDTACEFGGINGYINTTDIDVTRDITLMAWVKNLNSTRTWKAIISKEQSYQLLGDNGDATDDRKPQFALYISDAWLRVTADSGISPDVFHHIAATYDGSIMKLFVDGVQVKNQSQAGNLGSNNLMTSIGYESNEVCGANCYFNGTIDEVLIFNRSLSDDEIYNHWAYENLLDRIGLMDRAYRFYIIVNNTDPFYKNQSEPVRTLHDENVVFNYTDLGYTANVPSTVIYQDDGTAVPYSISGSTIRFSTDIVAKRSSYFTVYFDDDSNFPERTATVTGNNNLTETIGHIQAFPIVSYGNIMLLNNSNYTRVMNSTGMPRDFSVRLLDLTGATILNFGPPPPPSGNIVSFQRYALYQNSTGHIRRGRLSVQTW